MPTQSATNVLAALKREAVMGTPEAAGAGATQIRLIDSPGLTLGRGEIVSAERRRDQIRSLGRLGSKTVSGTYNTELSVGGAIDLLLESIARGTWQAALALNAVANVTTTTNSIVRAAGSWITDGIRIGDIVTITGDATAANNDIRLRVTGVTATTISVAGSPLTTNATARTLDVTRLKKVITPPSPIYHSYTIEQYDVDIDASELFYGCRLASLGMAMRPNAMTTCAWGFTGLNRDIISQAASPYFTDPDVSTGLSLVADDSWIRYNGEDVVMLTGLDINFAIANALQPVIGSIVSPDVFMNDLTISGSVTALREDLAALAAFDAETEFEIQVVLTEPTADPKPTIGVYLPRVKVSSVDAPFLGGDGPKVETRNLMVGPYDGGTAEDDAAAIFYSSAA